jgi:ribosome biogenesis protein YTM1
MASDPVAAALPTERGVAVTFFTRHAYPVEQMPTTTFVVPSTTLLDGLNALVNDVLFSESRDKPAAPIPFDFVINDEYLPAAVSLDTFLRRQRRRLGIAASAQEEVLHVEYLPAFQAQEGAKLPHDDWISCVRAPVAGNAEFLVTAAYDHAVRVWSGDSCLAIGTGHVEAVKAVAIVPTSVVPHTSDEGTALTRRRRRGRAEADEANQEASFEFVSASKDGTIRAWKYDAATRKLQPLVATASALGATIHADSVDSIDVDPSGRFVATGSWDNTSAVLDYKSLIAGGVAKPLYSFADHARAVLSVRFSPQSAATLYTTGLDGSVKLWDIEKGMLKGTLKGSDHSAQSMSIRPPSGSSASSNDLVLCGHTDNRVRLYDPRVGDKTTCAVKTWAGHRQWVYSVAWLWRSEEADQASAANATLFASASEDATLRIWDLRSTAAALITLDSLHSDGILDVTYAGSMKLATGGKDNRTKSVSVEQP